MILYGLDLATHTGWARCEDGRITSSGVQTFQRGDDGYGRLFHDFRVWLTDLTNADRLERGVTLAYEAPHFQGGPSTRILVGLSAHLQERAYYWECQLMSVHTGTLKKWATGDGKAKKADMMLVALRSFNYADYSEKVGTITDDEADAILVALWAWEQREKE